MTLPVTIPNEFSNATSSIPLSQLDSNFNTLSNVINQINAGTQQLANANVAILIVNAGNATAPTITTTGDTNTGIFFPAADTIAFAEGGAEAMRINSSGNVGIGTTSPSARLNIASTGNGYRALFDDTTNDNTLGVYSDSTRIRHIAVNNARGSYKSYGVECNGIVFNATNGAESARITSGGEFLVGKTTFSTSNGFQTRADGLVASSRSGSTNSETTWDTYSTGASAYRFYVGMGGTVYATNTTISAISDQRLKENIQDIDVGLDAVMALKPRKFDWKEGKGKDIKGDRGWIAQEFEQVFPDLIDEWKDPAPEGEEPYKSVRQDLIPVLVKSIQELKAITDTQAQTISALEARIAALEND